MNLAAFFFSAYSLFAGHTFVFRYVDLQLLSLGHISLGSELKVPKGEAGGPNAPE